MEEETELVNQRPTKVTVFEIVNKDNENKTDENFSSKSFNLRIILIIVLANILYLISLDNCNDPVESICWNYIFPRITRLILVCSLSSLIFAIIYLLSITCFLKSIYIPLCIANQFILYNYDDGQTFQNHGGYNRLLFIVCTIIFLILGIIFIGIKRAFVRINLLFRIIIFFSIYFYFVLLYNRLQNSCNNWYDGLKNSTMNNDIGCRIIKPGICWLNITSGMFDLSKWFDIDCKYKYNSDEELYYKNKKIIAFPDTKMYNLTQRSYKNIQKLIFEDLKEVTDISDHEVILDRSDRNNPNIKINIKENFSAKERARNIKYNDKFRGADIPLSDNVIFIFLDTLSRTQFKRKLPTVYKWIEQFYQNKTSPVEAFQFFKYQASQPNTRLTLTPILTGTHPTIQERINYFIHKYYQDFGFITAQTLNVCNSININYEPDDTKSFLWNNFDHELFSIYCDPNYWIPGKEYGLLNGPYSSLRRCLYGKDTFEYMFDFSTQFLNLYPDERKYLEMYFIDGHELTNEVITHLDKRLYEWLKLHEDYFFSTNTTILFISDHGLHMNGFSGALNLEDIIKELVLPNLLVLLPRYVSDIGFGDIMSKNENMMIGSYDIHSFLQEISGARNFSIFGKSLLRNIPDRECGDLHVKYSSCRCFK